MYASHIFGVKDDTLIVYTKHFSLLRLKCREHRGQDDDPCEGNLRVALFSRHDDDAKLVTVKIVLVAHDAPVEVSFYCKQRNVMKQTIKKVISK